MHLPPGTHGITSTIHLKPGVMLRGGAGNVLSENRIELSDTYVLDRTGRAVVRPPEVQDYKASVPDENDK